MNQIPSEYNPVNIRFFKINPSLHKSNIRVFPLNQNANINKNINTPNLIYYQYPIISNPDSK